ncbi:MAG: HAD-IIA family hydrolase [Ktedonobacteraceae bacterium]|nr:HAD-IIA family hydrolase [Ktedonobacteraceae bacterium]
MFLDQYDIFLLDLDGVIFLGEQPLPAAVSSLQRLRHSGKILRFLTNDPRPSRQQVQKRLHATGIEVSLDEIITSGWATATFLHQQQIHAVYLSGSPGLVQEFESLDIQTREQHQPEAVVVGCDEQITYQHLNLAARLVARGAPFIATNADKSFPTPDGPALATGALVRAIEVASGKQPLIIGKPFPALFRAALQGLGPQLRAVMIGDTPETDILGAHRLGITALLVSATSPSFPSPLDLRKPDAVIADLSQLFDPAFSAPNYSPPAFAWPQRVEAGVAAVIFDQQGRILLGKRADNGLWGLPSGHVEAGETVEDAIIREVHEETGLRVQVNRLIGLYSDPVSQVFSYPTGEIIQFVTSCFECSLIGGSLFCDKTEILEAAFFSVDALPSDLLPMHPRWLSDALAGATVTFIR